KQNAGKDCKVRVIHANHGKHKGWAFGKHKKDCTDQGEHNQHASSTNPWIHHEDNNKDDGDDNDDNDHHASSTKNWFNLNLNVNQGLHLGWDKGKGNKHDD